MKLLVEIEDQIVGIITGILVIAYTQKYFTIPFSKTLLIISLVLFFIFLVLDIFYNFKDIGGQHIGWMIITPVNSLADIALVASMFSWLTKISLPFTNIIVPYFENQSIVLGVGFFFLIASVIWLILYFTDF